MGLRSKGARRSDKLSRLPEACHSKVGRQGKGDKQTSSTELSKSREGGN